MRAEGPNPTLSAISVVLQLVGLLGVLWLAWDLLTFLRLPTFLFAPF